MGQTPRSLWRKRGKETIRPTTTDPGEVTSTNAPVTPLPGVHGNPRTLTLPVCTARDLYDTGDIGCFNPTLVKMPRFWCSMQQEGLQPLNPFGKAQQRAFTSETPY